MRGECLHTRAAAYRWTEVGWVRVMVMTAGPGIGQALAKFGYDRVICMHCDEWFGLGPANEAGEHAMHVAFAVKAAELAVEQTFDELEAWTVAQVVGGHDGCTVCDVIWLAKEIAE